MKSNLVSDLSSALCELQGIKMLLHVGLKRNSAKGKIDLLAGCDEGGIEKYSSLIKSLLEDRYPNENFFVCDDSVRFDLPTGSGGIAICDSSLLIKQIEGWIDGKNLGGQHRIWSTGYWLPEALCGDLATAKTLYDVTDISVRFKELLTSYPNSLSKYIAELCFDEIRQKVLTLDKLHANATIERELCLSDIIASMMRLGFASSKIYFRGFRSLEEQAKLLRPSDIAIYKLALDLSKKRNVAKVLSEIKKLTQL